LRGVCSQLPDRSSGELLHQIMHLRCSAIVVTTQIYTHVLNRGGQGVLSPLDR